MICERPEPLRSSSPKSGGIEIFFGFGGDGSTVVGSRVQEGSLADKREMFRQMCEDKNACCAEAEPIEYSRE